MKSTANRRLETEQWMMEPCQVYGLFGQRALLSNARNGVRQIVSAEALGWLQLCDRFDTLEGHSARIRESMRAAFPASAPQDLVETNLRAAAEAGLMRSLSDFRSFLGSGDDVVSAAPLTLVVRASGGRGVLRELLGAVSTLRQRHPGTYGFRVVDEATTLEQRAQVQRDVVEARSSFGIEVAYFGQTEQEDLIRELRAVFASDAEVVDFLLGDPHDNGHARSWNRLLLATAGQRLVVLDNQAGVWEPRGKGSPAQPGACFEQDPWRMRVFSDMEEVQTQGEVLDLDPCLEHARFLGQGLGACLGKMLEEGAGELRLDSVRTADLVRLEPDSRAALTFTGLRGDPGDLPKDRLLALAAVAAKARGADERAYRISLEAPLVESSVAALCFSPLRWNTLTPLTGVDGSRMVPPWTPQVSAAGALFGEIFGFIRPGDVAVHLPWTLPRLPRDRAGRSPLSMDTAPLFEYSDFVKAVADAALPHCHASDPGQRLRFLGELLLGHAENDDAGLAKVLREQRSSAAAARLLELDAARQHLTGAADFVARDFARLQQAFVGAVLGAEGSANLLDGVDGDRSDQLSAVRRRLQLWGRALCLWPALWTHRSAGSK